MLSLDPGETTGWCRFEGANFIEGGQWATGSPEELAERIQEVNTAHKLDRVIYEEYRVRGNKFKEHVGSEVVTIQHVGAIKVVAAELGIALTKQSAGMAKGFATDIKLRRWGLWQPNQRHFVDALRHSVYYLLFVAERKVPRAK